MDAAHRCMCESWRNLAEARKNCITLGNKLKWTTSRRFGKDMEAGRSPLTQLPGRASAYVQSVPDVVPSERAQVAEKQARAELIAGARRKRLRVAQRVHIAELGAAVYRTNYRFFWSGPPFVASSWSGPGAHRPTPGTNSAAENLRKVSKTSFGARGCCPRFETSTIGLLRWGCPLQQVLLHFSSEEVVVGLVSPLIEITLRSKFAAGFAAAKAAAGAAAKPWAVKAAGPGNVKAAAAYQCIRSVSVEEAPAPRWR